MKKFLALVLALVLALSLAACSGGAGYQIGIPADATNGGRALLLLQDLGILTLKEGVGLEATEQDIVENPHNVTIKAMEAANLPASLPDLDFAVINGNYASGAGIGDKVLTTEDAESVAAQTYGNVVAVKEGRENDPAVQALVAVLMSGDVQAWIEESYNGVVMPMGAQELDIPEIAEPVTLKVGASPSPHAEILEHVKPLLAEHNVELDIVEFDDYVMPNTGVEDGSLDANYFQHQPYLTNFNAEQGTDLVSAGSIHYEPLGVYAGKSSDLANVPDGAQIGIPADATNGGRALLLLQDNGVLTLKDGIDLDYFRNAGDILFSEYDGIAENPHNVEIVAMEAANLPASLPDLDFAVINGNYAIPAGIADKLLASEDASGEAAQVFANIVAVRAGDEERAEIQALVNVLKSDEMKAWITEKYEGSVLPVA